LPHKGVPLKMLVFVWWLFHNRLTTKDNLIHLGIIHNDSQLCVNGCDDPEMASNLFLDCCCFGSIWYLVRKWLGISGVDHADITNHFIQFSNIVGRSKARRSIMQLISFSCTWEIWKERNNKIFNNNECSTIQLLEKIKARSFWWMKANHTTISFSHHNWWLSPLLCLGIE